MVINEEIKNIVQNKYEEAKKDDKKVILLDQETLGGLMLYINEKPKYFIASFTIDSDTLYIGNNILKNEEVSE